MGMESNNILCTIVDSIVVKVLHKNCVIKGVGNELHLYSKDSAPALLPYRLHGKVHGIESSFGDLGDNSSNKLLVFGEKEFILLDYKPDLNLPILLHRAHLTDWISAAKVLGHSQEFILLTAHSVLLRFSYREGNTSVAQKYRLVGKYSCVDKSTLYCSHLHGSSWKNLLIFGGNAFGELIIWQPSVAVNVSENVNKIDLLQRFHTHNGVIFSIDYNAKGCLLITTSDDRSIKFWHATQTVGKKGDLDMKLKLVASGFGHVARVFQGKIIQHNNEYFAISVSEDSHFCLWMCTGELLFKRRHHFGATIWNLDYDAETKTLFSVDSTGDIIAYGLQEVLLHRQSSTALDISCEHFVEINSKTKEYIAKVKFLTPQLLVGVTNKQRLLYKVIFLNDGKKEMSVEKLDVTDWLEVVIFKPPVNYKCIILEVYEDLIALCGYKHLTLLKYNANIEDFSLLYDGQLLEGLIRACHFLGEKRWLLVVDEVGNCILLQINHHKLVPQCSITLPRCKEPWPTAALALEYNAESEFPLLLLLSNRIGDLMLFKRQPKSMAVQYELACTLKQPHGYWGATALIKVQIEGDKCGKKSGTKMNYVYSAGHDGQLKLLEIEVETGKLQLCSRELIPVTWVERLILLKGMPSLELHSPLLLLLGFNDNCFVVWSRQHNFLVQFPCGGGHRSWDFVVHEQRHCYWVQLVCIRQRRVFVQYWRLLNVVQSALRLPVRRVKWHTRPCNAMIMPQVGYQKQKLLITAGDDNLVKMFTLQQSAQDAVSQKRLTLRLETELHTHISNVRALQIALLSDQRHLIFSGGGRAQLCVSELTQFVCDSEYGPPTFHIQELLSYMLSPSSGPDRNSVDYTSDPETRIMAIDVLLRSLPCSETVPIAASYIYLGCSDGWVRQFELQLLETQLPNWRLIPRATLYCNQCILQIRLLGELFVVIAATDGWIQFYDLQLKNCALKVRHHESGVNALDMLQFRINSSDINRTEVHILTGGDDQAVSYSRLLCTENNTVTLLETLVMPNLHTAQVTAVRLWRSPENDSGDGNGEGDLLAFTSGIDQRLIRFNLRTRQVEHINFSCVADIKGLCVDDQLVCYLYGNGLQIYDASNRYCLKDAGHS